MDTFLIFPCFPPEVRMYIWTLAVWTPRLVQFCFAGDDGYGWDIHLVSRVIPPLMHACSESRAAALQVHHYRFFEMSHTSLETYVNFEIDTICLTSAVLGFWFDWLTDAFQMLKASANLQDIHVDQVKHLAVNINWMNTHERVVFLACLPRLVSLETLTLFVESENPSQAEAKLVEIKEDDENAIWDYARNLADNELFSAFDGILQDIQKRYSDIIEDENHEHHDLFAKWSLPKLNFKKLEGNVLRQLSQREARDKMYFG